MGRSLIRIGKKRGCCNEKSRVRDRLWRAFKSVEVSGDNLARNAILLKALF